MKKIVRNVLAGAVSVALLAGCNDSSSRRDYPDVDQNPPVIDPPDQGVPGGPGDDTLDPPPPVVDPNPPEDPDLPDGDDKDPDEPDMDIFNPVLYGEHANSAFMAQIEDISGSKELDADGKAILENIAVEPSSDQALVSNIVVSKDSGTFQLISYTGSGEDLPISSENAGLQFDLKVNEKVGADGKVSFQLADESEAEFSIDLTSAINAYSGAATQRVNVPFSCFEGYDLSQSVIPFALQSTAVDFDLGTVRVVPQTSNASATLECYSDSEVFEGSEVTLFERLAENNDDNQRVIGRMNRRMAYNGTGTGWMNDEEFRYAGFYPNIRDEDTAEGDVGVILRYLNNDIETKDLSNFIESGYLSFDLYLEHSGGYPKADFEVWFSTADVEDDEDLFGKAETKSYYYPITEIEEGKWHTIQVDLKDLFTDKNGQVDINKLRNIKNLVIKTDVGDSEAAKSPKFYFNYIELIDKDTQDPM